MSQPKFDVVLFGATSFVGQITARYLARVARDSGTRWAIAGRSTAKLGGLATALRAEGLDADVEQIVVDSHDEVALRALAAQTRVIATSVGPYALYGEKLVGVCADSGTDYCDLTGEITWVADMRERHGARAETTGARIVNCCGFDSIPSDMGVYFLQQAAIERFGAACNQVTLRVKRARGGFSGGTVASLLNMAKQLAGDPTLSRRLADPYLLAADAALGEPRAAQRPRQVVHRSASKQNGRWIAPFLMAQVNEKIVHRSNALSNFGYGVDFRYDEAVDCGTGVPAYWRATLQTLGVGALLALLQKSWSRSMLERWILPKPGEGPSEEAQRAGFFALELVGQTAKQQTFTVSVRGDRDPGYGSTGKMFAESALCLAESARAKGRGGFLTPAVAFGSALIPRLANAGVTLDIAEH